MIVNSVYTNILERFSKFFQCEQMKTIDSSSCILYNFLNFFLLRCNFSVGNSKKAFLNAFQVALIIDYLLALLRLSYIVHENKL